MKVWLVSAVYSQGGESEPQAIFSTEEKAYSWIQKNALRAYMNGPPWCVIGWYESRPDHKPSEEWFVKQYSNDYFVEEYEVDKEYRTI